MSSSTKQIATIMALVTLTSSICCHAAERGIRPDPRPAKQQFSGPGALDVLSDGTVVVYMTSREQPDPDRVLILPNRKVGSTALIERGSRSLIGDLNQRVEAGKTVIPFVPTQPGGTPESILSVTGAIEVSYRSAPKPTLEVEITGEDGTVFSDTRVLTQAESPLNPSFSSEDESVGGVAGTVMCSAACDTGLSGSISCDAKDGCYAFCRGGSPVVGCGRLAV